MNDEYLPKIVAFLCNWCAYTGADLAGVSRQKIPPSIRVSESCVREELILFL